MNLEKLRRMFETDLAYVGQIEKPKKLHRIFETDLAYVEGAKDFTECSNQFWCT